MAFHIWRLEYGKSWSETENYVQGTASFALMERDSITGSYEKLNVIILCVCDGESVIAKLNCGKF